MKLYGKRLLEVVGVAFGAGVTDHIIRHGFEPTKAGLQGLGIAGLVAVYGVLVKRLGADKQKPGVTR